MVDRCHSLSISMLSIGVFLAGCSTAPAGGDAVDGSTPTETGSDTAADVAVGADTKAESDAVAEVVEDSADSSASDAIVDAIVDAIEDVSEDAAVKEWGPMADAPEAFVPRMNHVTVWDPTEGVMYVCSGYSAGGNRSDCAGYKRSTDSWTILPTWPLSARRQAAGVWTGSELLVWGGDGGGIRDDGAGYSPATKTWTLLPAVPTGFEGRYGHSAVWTGTELVVFGGYGTSYTELNSGAAYNPTTKAWRLLPIEGAPSRRVNHAAAFASGKMIVHGGYGPCPSPMDCNDAFAWDPTTNAWSPLASPPIGGRSYHTATVLGSKVAFFGGLAGDAKSDGAILDAATGTWTVIPSTKPTLSGRRLHTAWFAAGKFHFWGGLPLSGAGASLDAAGKWTPLATLGAPSPRYGHATVWTGTEAIVWGGRSETDWFRDGRVHRP